MMMQKFALMVILPFTCADLHWCVKMTGLVRPTESDKR